MAAYKMMNVSLEEARQVIEAAEEKAKKINQPSNIPPWALWFPK